MIEHAPRRPDYHRGAVAKRANLPLHVESADERRHPHSEVGAEPGEFARRLLGELARRREHENLRLPFLGVGYVQKRQRESERLARPRLRLHDYVVVEQPLVFEHGRLHGHRMLEALAFDGPEQRRL